MSLAEWIASIALGIGLANTVVLWLLLNWLRDLRDAA